MGEGGRRADGRMRAFALFGRRDAGTDAGAASDQGEVEAFNSFNYWKLDFPPVVKDDL